MHVVMDYCSFCKLVRQVVTPELLIPNGVAICKNCAEESRYFGAGVSHFRNQISELEAELAKLEAELTATEEALARERER